MNNKEQNSDLNTIYIVDFLLEISYLMKLTITNNAHINIIKFNKRICTCRELK